MANYKNIRNSVYYGNWKGVYSNLHFEELLLNTLIILDENIYIEFAILYVKLLKEKTGYKIKECKEFFELLRYTELIEVDYKDPEKSMFEIKEVVNEINSLDDIFFIIDHELTMEQYLRRTKLNNLIKRIGNDIKH